MRTLGCTLLLVVFAVAPVLAINPGTEVVVPAAARGNGAGGSLWVTSLYVLNPNSEDVTVTFSWLVRNQANPSPTEVVEVVEAGSSLYLQDPVLDMFGVAAGGGAIRVSAPLRVVVNAGIFNRAGGEEFGQGFEGIPTRVAVGAGQTTHAAGLANNSEYRSNFFAIDVSGGGSVVSVAVLFSDGQVAGQRDYALGAYEPILKPVGDIFADPVDNGILRFEVQAGSVLVGGSRVNQGTGDPLTLNAWWDCGENAPSPGNAPASMAGMSFDMVVAPIECGMDPFTRDALAEVTSDTEVTVTVYEGQYSSTLTLPIESYTAAGDLGYIETSLPDWGITNTWLTMIWSSATEGRFTGAATDTDGSPIQFSGSFAVRAK